jgi:uncharacterized membrane protein (DUF485 family)
MDTKKHKELEERVTVLLWLFAPIFLIFLFDSFHGTGLAISFGNSANIIASTFFGIFVFVLAIVLISIKVMGKVGR